MPTAVSASYDPLVELVAAQAEVRRSERDVVADRGHEQLVVGILEHDAHPAADLLQVLLHDGQAADAHRRPACAACTPFRCSTSVVLPGAVRAEQRHPLTAPDREVDAEQRLGAVRVGERQVRSTSRAGPVTGSISSRHAVAPTPIAQIGNAASGRIDAASHSPGRGVPLARSSGIEPVVAARQHREVDPLAALVRPDEERPCRSAAIAFACQIHRAS